MWVNIEIYSACNLRCKFCSLDHSKAAEIMSLELLELILDKLTQIPEKIERIELHNGGETLLHPKLGDVLTLIGKYKSKIPGNPSLVLLTNATPLSEKK